MSTWPFESGLVAQAARMAVTRATTTNAGMSMRGFLWFALEKRLIEVEESSRDKFARGTDLTWAGPGWGPSKVWCLLNNFVPTLLQESYLNSNLGPRAPHLANLPHAHRKTLRDAPVRSARHDRKKSLGRSVHTSPHAAASSATVEGPSDSNRAIIAAMSGQRAR